MRDYELHDKVKINETGENGFIVWYDEELDHDSLLIEIESKEEMPKFYKRKDITIIK